MKSSLILLLLVLGILGASCKKDKTTAPSTCGEKPLFVVVDKSGHHVCVEVYEDSIQAKAGGDLWYDYCFDVGRPDSSLLARDATSNQVYCNGKQLTVSLYGGDMSIPSYKRFTIISLNRGSTNYYQVDPDFTFRQYQP